MDIFNEFYVIRNSFRNYSFNVRKYWRDIVNGTFVMCLITTEWVAFCPCKMRARNE